MSISFTGGIKIPTGGQIQTTIAGTGGVTDPFFSSVQLLMQMTDNTDLIGATVTNTIGSPLFGDGVVNGAGDPGSVLTINGTQVVTVANTNVATMGAGDWTIEFWYFSPTVEGSVIGTYTNPPLYWAFHTNAGDLQFFADQGVGTTWDIVNGLGMAVSANTWYHIAVTYDGTTVRGFRDGVEQWNVVTAIHIGTLTTPIQIGANPSNINQNRWSGSLDDFRITVGVARYTSNFTPPTTEFPTS